MLAQDLHVIPVDSLSLQSGSLGTDLGTPVVRQRADRIGTVVLGDGPELIEAVNSGSSVAVVFTVVGVVVVVVVGKLGNVGIVNVGVVNDGMVEGREVRNRGKCRW